MTTERDEELQIVRLFDAPRDLVFRNWIEPAHVAVWFAPDGYAVTGCRIDARPGGQWSVDYRSQGGEAHTESGEFRELSPPDKLVFTLRQRSGSGESGPETLVTVQFAAVGDKTEMTFLQRGFRAAETRDGNREGWLECFKKLDAHLAKK